MCYRPNIRHFLNDNWRDSFLYKKWSDVFAKTWSLLAYFRNHVDLVYHISIESILYFFNLFATHYTSYRYHYKTNRHQYLIRNWSILVVSPTVSLVYALLLCRVFAWHCKVSSDLYREDFLGDARHAVRFNHLANTDHFLDWKWSKNSLIKKRSNLSCPNMIHNG